MKRSITDSVLATATRRIVSTVFALSILAALPAALAQDDEFFLGLDEDIGMEEKSPTGAQPAPAPEEEGDGEVAETADDTPPQPEQPDGNAPKDDAEDRGEEGGQEEESPTDAQPAPAPEEEGDGEVAGTADDTPPQPEQPDGNAPKDDAEDRGEEGGQGVAVDMTPEELQMDEEVRRREGELRAENFMIKANQAWREGDHKEAINLFEKADKRLAAISLSQPRIIEKREKIKEAIAATHADWANALANEAQQLADTAKFDTAISKAEKAAQTDPSLREQMDKRIRLYTELRRKAEFKVSVEPKEVDPGRVERAFDINVLLEQGEVFFRNGRYADARDKFEQALQKDPYEVRAMDYLRKINERLINLSDERRKATVRERIAEVSWKWNEPVTPLVSGGGEKETRAVPKSGNAVVQKLQDIVIPQIDFEDAPIQVVVEFLKKRSVELDPDGEGVNIILYEAPNAGGTGADTEMPRPAEPQTGGGGFGDLGMGGDTDDEFGMGGGPNDDFGADQAGDQGTDDATATAGSGKRITLTLDRIPLGEAIRYICLAANLKYRVDTSAVLIAGKDVPFEEMETRFYSVEAGVLDLSQVGSAGGGGGDDGDDGGFGAFDGGFDQAPAQGEAGDAAGSSEELKTFFGELGVDFPVGSRIAYYQRAGKLVVTNTPRHLRSLEKALKEINKTPPQVTIAAKFVEVSQTDLEELGFDWLLEEGSGYYDDGIVYGSGDDNWALQVLKQTGTTGKTAPKLSNALRFGSGVIETISQGSDQILSVNSILGGVSFNTILHALAQKTNSDLLSSPKVTTINGTTAVLKMVEKRHIATSWTEPELDSDEEGDSFTPSIPETEEQEFGVILDVTPRVAPDGYSIELELFPRVEDFIGYDDRFNYTVVLDGESYEAKNMTPITSERSVQTKVIVWDGETVVLGGMISERVNYWNDKVPFLGDVPVMGRLFRSKGEMSEKTNLLIFVTARLVNPAGLPIRSNEVRGLPDFRR